MSLASDKIALWRNRPDIFVRECFGAVPDAWQDDVLQAFPSKQRIALCASKGPGKTTVLAWLALNFLLTRPHPRGAATSITGDTLADTLWPEIAKWMNKSPIFQQTFTWTKSRIFSNEHPNTWWLSARPWPKSANKEELGATLAGLHEDYILFLIDEAGGIPDAILAAAEASLSSCIEGHIVMAGNPIKLDGVLHRACVVERKLWHVIEINADPLNPKRSPRVSVEWAQQQIDKWGRDHPYVMVNVLGKFPPCSFNALLSIEEVREAMNRDYREQDYGHAARILGIDVAREGDDSSVIFPRQGLQSFTPLVFRNIDGTQGGNYAARKWQEWDADACFIDNTGGFGSSWIDNLRRLGFAATPVHFSETKNIDAQFKNKRSSMIWQAAEWVKSGGALPNIPELFTALTQITYTHQNDKLIIEPKEIFKDRFGFSYDHLDGFALTFASPVIRAAKGGKSRFTSSYDPLDSKYIESN